MNKDQENGDKLEVKGHEAPGLEVSWKMVCESFLKGGLGGILDKKLLRAVAAGKKAYSGAEKRSLIDSTWSPKKLW